MSFLEELKKQLKEQFFGDTIQEKEEARKDLKKAREEFTELEGYIMFETVLKEYQESYPVAVVDIFNQIVFKNNMAPNNSYFEGSFSDSGLVSFRKGELWIFHAERGFWESLNFQEWRIFIAMLIGWHTMYKKPTVIKVKEKKEQITNQEKNKKGHQTINRRYTYRLETEEAVLKTYLEGLVLGIQICSEPSGVYKMYQLLLDKNLLPVVTTPVISDYIPAYKGSLEGLFFLQKQFQLPETLKMSELERREKVTKSPSENSRESLLRWVKKNANDGTYMVKPFKQQKINDLKGAIENEKHVSLFGVLKLAGIGFTVALGINKFLSNKMQVNNWPTPNFIPTMLVVGILILIGAYLLERRKINRHRDSIEEHRTTIISKKNYLEIEAKAKNKLMEFIGGLIKWQF